MMFGRGFAILLTLSMLAASCDLMKHQPTPAAPKPITSEELRLWDIGQAKLRFAVGQRYRVVGKIRSIGMADDGAPHIIFTGIDVYLPRDFDRKRLEALVPDRYLAVDCQVTKRADHVFLILNQCDRIGDVPDMSADTYKVAYDRNLFKADSLVKDKYIVVEGLVREKSKLTTGENYISFVTQDGFSDVVAVIDPEDRSLFGNYEIGRRAAILCRGGARWNPAGSLGLKSCRFLTN